MKAYKVELLIIDNEEVGQENIKYYLENTKYVYPKVMDIKSVDIDWIDEHPLNKIDTIKEEYNKLFK